jgi:hypothetical protein
LLGQSGTKKLGVGKDEKPLDFKTLLNNNKNGIFARFFLYQDRGASTIRGRDGIFAFGNRVF